jgi:hypothetical protein
MNHIAHCPVSTLTNRVRIAIASGQRELAYGYMADLMRHLQNHNMPLQGDALELYCVLLLEDIAMEARLTFV